MDAAQFNIACIAEIEKQRNDFGNQLVNAKAELNLTQQENAALKASYTEALSQITALKVAAGVKKGNKLPAVKADDKIN